MGCCFQCWTEKVLRSCFLGSQITGTMMVQQKNPKTNKEKNKSKNKQTKKKHQTEPKLHLQQKGELIKVWAVSHGSVFGADSRCLWAPGGVEPGQAVSDSKKSCRVNWALDDFQYVSVSFKFLSTSATVWDIRKNSTFPPSQGLECIKIQKTF